MKVLLAIDGSPCSAAALAEIGKRPWPAGTEFKIVTAYELPIMPSPEAWMISPDYTESLQQAVLTQAQLTIETARERLNKLLGHSFKVTSEVMAGSPRNAILELAESWNADLIVVGSHGYRAWERFLLGSVSQAVVSHAKCSVEVVRCKDNAPETSAA